MGRIEKKKAKSKWIKYIGISAITLLLALGIYIVYSYNQGLSAAQESPIKESKTTTEPFEGPEPQFGEINVLLIGSDTRGDDKGNSDTIMIAHYNQDTHDMKIVSLMRDIYVDIPEHGKYKINAAYAFGGPELLRKTIKQNFDIDINYYAIVGFEGFPKIVDLIAPNGIEVDIENEMKYGIGMTLHPGKQVLNGKELLGYVRFRHDRMSDFGRVGRQQEVMSKLKEQAVSMHSVVNLPKILGMAEPYINTNVDASTLLAIAKGLIFGNSKQMETLRLPLQDTFTNEHVDVGAVLNIDFDKNTQALKEFLSSDDISTEEVAAPN